jgi:hypothetical protein
MLYVSIHIKICIFFKKTTLFPFIFSPLAFISANPDSSGEDGLVTAKRSEDGIRINHFLKNRMMKYSISIYAYTYILCVLGG